MRLHTLLVPAVLLYVAPSPRAQLEALEPIPYCPQIVSVYVDGGTGVDPDPSSPTFYTDVLAYLDNPNMPFQTIQFAIDVCQYGVGLHWSQYPDAQGVVYVMPGVYGPSSWQAKTPGEAFDQLPILMRDRVHVQGQGMRSTTIRGGGTDPNRIFVFWPDAPTCGSSFEAQVLVDFSLQSDQAGGSPLFGTPPWAGTGDTEEKLDRLGFQGGDIQVLNHAEGVGLGRVSNCLFDMRDGLFPDDGVTGPYFGLMMTHVWFGEEYEYFDMPMNVLNNTFILGEVSPEEPHLARPEAVGIIDVNEPLCGWFDPDPDPTLRGIGMPSIQNNVFRTLTSQTTQRAMLGIHKGDAEVAVGGGSAPGATNAFNAARVGGDNGVFYSAVAPIDLPVPKVDLAVPGLDPSFVGELLAPSLVAAPEYRDWRLIFRSPIQNKGSNVNASGDLIASNGTVYDSPFCYELSSFRWDGEGYGNPRVVNEIDIGCDEVHFLIMAGTWGNDSVSHNLLPGVLDPNVVDVGAARRYMLYPDWTTAPGNTSTLNGTLTAYAFTPGGSIPAWQIPPGAVFPPRIDGTLPAFYQKRYIPFTNPPPTPTPWVGPIGSVTLTNPVNGLGVPVGVRVQLDNEGAGAAAYFNAQAVVTLPNGNTYRSNLQAEYR